MSASPDRCPRCGSTEVTRYAWGHPGEHEEPGVVYGCRPPPDPYDRRCDACGFTWEARAPRRRRPAR